MNWTSVKKDTEKTPSVLLTVAVLLCSLERIIVSVSLLRKLGGNQAKFTSTGIKRVITAVKKKL